MSLTEYIRILWRRGWIILLLAALTAASAFVFSTIQTPTYKSTINILIQPARTDFGLTQSAKLLLDSYVAFLDTNRVAQSVIDSLQLDMTPDALRGRVSAVNSLFTASSNEIGDFRAGSMAAVVGPVPSVIIGGVMTLAVAWFGWRRFSGIRQLDRLDHALH